MLSRYTMHRGKPPEVAGIRMNTRKHTRHCLRPSVEVVTRFLDPNDAYGWDQFKEDYLSLVQQRFAENRSLFDQLAERARHEDVYLGCSCPTKSNPNVQHCHTWLALKFMAARYPDLEVIFPK